MRIENSFIPVDGVGPKTEQKLWRAGTTHWDAFDGSAVGPIRAERIQQFIETARPHLQSPTPSFFASCVPAKEHWRLYENFQTTTAFLDIETTGLDRHRDYVTTVSIHQDGSTITLVRGDDLSAGALSEALTSANLLVTFNGRRFDVPFLEQNFNIEIDLPHVDLMSACRSLGYSGGLTEIESTFGIDRSQPDISGRDAVRLWHEYEAGRDGALEQLIQYNRTDTENMAPLMDEVAQLLHQRRFAQIIE